ncbi:DUF2851 family protein [Aquimarina sp. W85]|uniref:DUF2851 family protein n=1 Tax=Aquimarina rhodophyticola TaxID=3342246 RepID=UPI00366D559B
MKEDFLHYVWKYRKFGFDSLYTTDGSSVDIISVGSHNTSRSGPDFFNSCLLIEDQKWAGTVEIHIKSSDWYVHGHEKDINYDNVILHVVWEDDVEVLRKNNSKVPTLALKEFVAPAVLNTYNKLVLSNKSSSWLSCEKQLVDVPAFTAANWKEKLYIERLLFKNDTIVSLCKTTKNDWEAVFYTLVAKGFGLNANGEAFMSMVQSIPYKLIRKYKNSIQQLEALLFGQQGLLDQEIEDPYYQSLQEEYKFIKHKHDLSNVGVLSAEFFRLRPSNFPTIRLSQYAAFVSSDDHFFESILNFDRIEQFYNIFNVATSNYWETHYTFGKESKFRKKRITNPFVDLLLINVVVPFLFAYNRSQGSEDHSKLFALIQQLRPEQNAVIEIFKKAGMQVNSAMDSQACLQLKTLYCVKNKCLQCAFGNYFLNHHSI